MGKDIRQEKKELVIGCGRYRKKRIFVGDDDEYKNPTFLDMNTEVKPDVIWNLEVLPLPFEDNEFDEIHAYDVLEHIGAQGDWEGFFEEFSEYYRILKPDGFLLITAPKYDSLWAWSDPGHTRIISRGTFSFLDRAKYEEETQMTDYRQWWKGNFRLINDLSGDSGAYILMAVK